MDVEKLITLVFQNRCLWDMKGKNYHNRDVSRQKWEIIAHEMNNNVEAVKNKWRGLRDTFRKELNKVPKKRSGQSGEVCKEPTWPYFKSMLFIRDQFVPRKLQSSIPETDTQSENGDQESENLSESETDIQTNSIQDNSRESETETNLPSENFVAPQPKRLKSTRSNAIEKLLVIEEQKLQEFKRKSEKSEKDKSKENADYHFFMSLLPYFRKVPEQRKMLVRMKLQQVFCDEENQLQQQSYYVQHSPYFSTPSPGESSQSPLTVLTDPSEQNSRQNAEEPN